MRIRTISIRTTLAERGLVIISGNVSRDRDYDPITEGCTGSPWCITGLLVTDADNEDITDDLDRYDTEKAEECLIDKYQEEEGFDADRLIDEAVQRGREYKHLAYS